LAQRSLWANVRPCRSKVNSSSKSISHRVCFSRKAKATPLRDPPLPDILAHYDEQGLNAANGQESLIK
jgi:hypothetical protein